jgi:Primase X
LDCRINAYPYYVGFDGINRQPPNFIFIDIDRCLFKTDKEFWLAVEKTYQNMNDILGGGAKPTSIWTGNGVHIYQPVEAVVLEQESLFANFDQPSQTFLKFAAQYLSNHKSDANNNPAFRSCLLRIPGSHNAKCIQQQNNGGIADSSTEIKIIQRWDGFRPKINPILYQFYIYLADAKIKEINSVQQLQRKKERYHIAINNNNNGNGGGFIQNNNTISWIEKLLQTPIDDYRKNAISLILAPYLINIKKLSYGDALNVISSWLDKCRQLRRLDSNLGAVTKYMLKESIRNGRRPLKFETLKLKNKILYEMLRQQNY